MINAFVNRHPVRAVALALCTLLLQGCSLFQSDDEKALEPAELIDFSEEMELRKVWGTSIGDGQGDDYNRLNIVVSGGRIYGAAADGTVRVVNMETGKEVWETELDDEISGGVGYGGDLVIVGTPDGDVIALDANSGSEVWRSKVASEVLSAPGADFDVVVVYALNGQITAFDSSTGELRWRQETNMPLLTLRGGAPVLMENGNAYVALANGRILAFKASNGTILWDGKIAQPQGQSDIERVVDIEGKPLVIGQTMYAVTYQGKLGAVSMGNGRSLWSRDASSYMSVAEGFGNLYVAESQGAVSAFEINGGALRWQNDQFARRQLSAPAVFSNYVAVGDFEGYVHVLSQVDGHVVGRERVDSAGLRADMLGIGDRLYVYDNDGGLTCYEPRIR